jgi:hypothetical protein
MAARQRVEALSFRADLLRFVALGAWLRGLEPRREAPSVALALERPDRPRVNSCVRTTRLCKLGAGGLTAHNHKEVP